ncbi:hypothetical protein ACDQ55_17960 [Chitinophaga sp. 30R24]|uniref:hypothetical protein n=1 Tax=Chitinophaga sp. 30R24 TaxID=3248838 RepID=UPI003B901E73
MFLPGFNYLYAQSSAQDRMTKMTPPTPEASSITRYGVYPVSMYTGLPTIEIPLYNLQVRDFSLPISLGYHASGIRVNDMASFVGLGWNLNAGGVISRTVMGLPDESSQGIFYRGIKRANQIGIKDVEDIDNICNQNYDSEPDLFSYNFMGKSGRFIFDASNQVMKITYDDVKIEFVDGNFRVTDTNGRVYIFEDKSYHANFSSAGNKMGFPVTSWYLSKVILENKKDTITFSYIGHSGVNVRTIDYSMSFGPVYDGALKAGFSSGRDVNFFYENSTDLYLNQITFPNGKIRFVAHSGRQDYGGYMLDSVIVYNNSNVLKRMALEHSYFNADLSGYNFYAEPQDKYRLKLVGVKEYGTIGNDFRQYQLQYDERQLPPRNNCAIDWWGYYNGRSTNTHLIALDDNNQQYQITTTAGLQTTSISDPANRTPNETFMQAGILKRIYFPTGGYTDFEYEANRISTSRTEAQEGPGLRVKMVSNYTSTGVIATRDEYKYGENESGLGEPRFFDYLFKQRTFLQDYFYGDLTHAAYMTAQRLEIASKPLFNYSDIGGNTIVYPVVTKYQTSAAGDNGKSIYTFEFEKNDKIYFNQRPDPNLLINAAWDYGQLIKEQHYKRSNGNVYELISEKTNKYETFVHQTAYGLKVARKLIVINGTDLNGGTIIQDKLSQYWDYYDYPIPAGLKRLSESTESFYGNPGEPVLKKTISYRYNGNDRILPVETESANSKGQVVLEKTKYPKDKATISNLSPAESVAIDAMLSKNIQEAKIEKEVYNNNNFLERYHFESGINNNNPDLVILKKLRLTRGSAAEEDRYIISDYDNWGNPIQRGLPGGPWEVYLWDYKGSSLVAEVMNATLKEVAYTSFEADANGNWTYTGSITIGAAPTGTKYYNLAATTPLSKTVTNGTKYIVSYWSNTSSPYNITGASGTVVKGKTIGGWTFFRHEITATSTMFSITGAGGIDEVRLYPAGATMTTYTYQPLVGITSACTANDRIAYYEYDNFGALQVIRDEDRNILKVLDYQYQQDINQ